MDAVVTRIGSVNTEANRPSQKDAEEAVRTCSPGPAKIRPARACWIRRSAVAKAYKELFGGYDEDRSRFWAAPSRKWPAMTTWCWSPTFRSSRIANTTLVPIIGQGACRLYAGR